MCMVFKNELQIYKFERKNGWVFFSFVGSFQYCIKLAILHELVHTVKREINLVR